MAIKVSDRRPTQWKCTTCKVTRSVRKGTWLDPSKFPIWQIVRFVSAWAHEYSSGDWCTRELGWDVGSVVEWSNFPREAVMNATDEEEKIGGPGHIVEVDETLFDHEGRVLPQQWICGGSVC